jgi:integrase
VRRAWKDRQRWLGGYVRVRGQRVTFVIEQRREGKRWHFSTRCSTESAALKVLERWQADPHAFARMVYGGRVVITRELVLKFTAWQLSGADAVTKKHAHYTGRYLLDWMEAVGARDVRSLTVPELKRTLQRWRGSHGLRIAALKVFFAWLREEEGALRHAEDVTLDWPVPQAVPAQRRKAKALALDTVIAILPHLSEGDREIVALLCGTGWHLQEAARFSKGGEILPGQRDGELATLVVQHKNRERVHTALTQQAHVDAARRVRERGGLAPYAFSRRFGDASERAGLERVTAGVFRHTFATWAAAAGGELTAISRFLHHKDPRTTKNFYVSMGLAPETVPVVHLSRPALLATTTPTPEVAPETPPPAVASVARDE